MSRKDARIKSKKWLKKAKESLGMSGKEVRKLMRKANIQDLDSRNDIRAMKRYLKEQDKSPTPSPSPEPKPTPTPTPTPAPTTENTSETSSGDGVDYKALYEDKNDDYEKLQGDLRTAAGDIGKYTTQIKGYETQIGRLTDLYEGVVTSNETLTTARDALQKKFDAQSEEFEKAKTESDAYREASVNQQLAGIRGGATAGGSNQSSYGTGSLASGRSGYSSSRRDRDKGLADYIMQQGGATDSVLNREGPVVERMDRRDRRQARREAQGQTRSMATGAGTGSYYASRFGG